MEPILAIPTPNPRLPLALDHLVVAARSLDEGEQWLRTRLGRPLVAGGSHPGFGTHNRLLGLGAECYLELIALDPAQANPPCVLFGLDQPAVMASIADTPRLLHLVFRVLPPFGLTSVLPKLAYDPGRPTGMVRGALAWDITLTPDGRPRGAGLLPTIIDWGASAHPASRLPDSGIRLEWLELTGPEAVIAEFPVPASPTKLELIAAPCSTICAAFLVDDRRIIIQSPLPLRDLA